MINMGGRQEWCYEHSFLSSPIYYRDKTNKFIRIPYIGLCLRGKHIICNLNDEDKDVRIPAICIQSLISTMYTKES